jgi:H+/Cl- antiporter ClcA
VGFLAVGYSFLFSKSIDIAALTLAGHPHRMLILSPLCFFLAAWVVERFAPTAGGTGVPAVIHALDLDSKTQSVEIDSYLNLRVAGVIVFSSLLMSLGGGGLGREGPFVHIAACIFYFVGKQFHKVWPYEEHRSWIVAGGAAGIAAAFNAPLAGVVFVLEELAENHFHRFKNFVFSGAIVGGLISQWLSGKYLYFGSVQVQHVPGNTVFLSMLMGLVCGLMAYPFHKLLAVHWREHAGFFGQRWRFSAILGLGVALIAVYVNPGTIGGGVRTIENLLKVGADHATWSLIGGRFMVTIMTHLSGCSGGFLAPALALGATIGSKATDILHFSDHNLLVLVSMSAFLSAIIRAPFTAWVIVMEMTDQHFAIFPLMVAAVVAHGTVRRIVDHKME